MHAFAEVPIVPSVFWYARICEHRYSRNAAIYGVENRIEFILGDAMKVLPTLKADTVFLSPPWGGPAYHDSKTFDLHSMIPPPLSALEMFQAARKVTPNVVFFLPRNIDAAQVAGLPAAAAGAAAVASTALGSGIAASRESDSLGQEQGEEVEFDATCELEKQFLNGKLKTTTAYFGKDIAITVGKKRAEKDRTANSGLDGGRGEVIVAPTGSGLDYSADATGSSEWYGDDGKEAAGWSGRYVRFSEEGDAVNGGDGIRVDDDGTGQDGAPSISQERENALYDAWMTK